MPTGLNTAVGQKVVMLITGCAYVRVMPLMVYVSVSPEACELWGGKTGGTFRNISCFCSLGLMVTGHTHHCACDPL